jgi:EAL domain-containing protein (putative c-di-GMP-specific phosphodiesterase class I)
VRDNPAAANFQICVNKSALQFRDDGSQHRQWHAYLDGLGLADDTIIVEVTEPMLQGAGKLITDKLLAFRDAGVQVSLDNFGTGHCSLAFLKRYDIDYLKINPDFIANLSTGSFEANLCEAIIVMAHKLGMKVIAEGVETELQLAILLQAGCDFGQGYLFSTPLPADALADLLDSPEPACG